MKLVGFLEKLIKDELARRVRNGIAEVLKKRVEQK